MKAAIVIVALVLVSQATAQRPLPRTDEQNQTVKRGIFWRAGIVGAAGLCAAQFGQGTMRDAGWFMVAGSGVSIFTVQIVIGDRVSDEPKRHRPRFVKYLY